MSPAAKRACALLGVAIVLFATLTCACATPAARGSVRVPLARHDARPACPHHAPPADAPRRDRGHDHGNDQACQHCHPSILVPRGDGALYASTVAVDFSGGGFEPLFDSNDGSFEFDGACLIGGADEVVTPPPTLLRLRCALVL